MVTIEQQKAVLLMGCRPYRFLCTRFLEYLCHGVLKMLKTKMLPKIAYLIIRWKNYLSILIQTLILETRNGFIIIT